jgi:preprotein translocase subunit SecD
VKSRGLWISVLFVGVLVTASLVGFATDTLKPTLGLDLEGGVSVILSAPDGTPRSVMDRALENIRNRVDAFGVGEPEIFLSGTTIEVQIPGLAKGTIDERARTQHCLFGADGESLGCFAEEPQATEALGGIEVRERISRVCLSSEALDVSDVCFGSEDEAQQAVDGAEVKKQSSGEDRGRFCVQDPAGATYGCFDEKQQADDAKAGLTSVATSLFCLVGSSGELSLPCFPSEDEATASLDGVGVEERTREFCVISSAGQNLGCFLSRDAAQVKLQETGQERLLELIGQTARLEQRQVLQVLVQGDPAYAAQQLTCDDDPATPVGACPSSPDALAGRDVWFLHQDDQTKYHLGEVLLTGDRIRRATAQFQGATQTSLGSGWQVAFDLTDEGAGVFGDVTTELVGSQLAIVLDNVVISAPTIESPITNGSGVITGSFNERSAEDLATVLSSGALPVELTKQQVLTVSPTLGEESLRQGIAAGIAGLVLLFVYLLFYYRLLGVVAWLGMSMWAVLALALVSLAGEAFGYALTLAGVAGLVISLGVTADSYIVFFERLKDEVRGGKSARSAVQPAFRRAYRTIVAADVVTGIAAVVLYLTAVSSVRGFALTLGVATLLDLFVVYFFKRPTVFLIARSRRLVGLRGFGLSSGVAADPDPAPAPVAGGST